MTVFSIDTREGKTEGREIHSVVDTLAETEMEHREKGRDCQRMKRIWPKIQNGSWEGRLECIVKGDFVVSYVYYHL